MSLWDKGAYGYGKYSFMGGRPDDTLILIDGVRLNNRLFGGIYLDTLPLIAIDRIEVLQGAQSLSFGTQAISGVINIVTKNRPQRYCPVNSVSARIRIKAVTERVTSRKRLITISAKPV